MVRFTSMVPDLSSDELCVDASDSLFAKGATVATPFSQIGPSNRGLRAETVETILSKLWLGHISAKMEPRNASFL